MFNVPSISRRILVALATSAVVIGCDQASTAPGPAPDRPDLGVFIVNEQDQAFTFDVQGCTELVHLSGTLHIALVSSVTPTGEATDRFHTTAKAVGTGLTTGATYTWTDVIDAVSHTQLPAPRVVNQRQSTKLIGQGDVPDLLVQAKFLFMRNDDGQPTVVIQEFNTVCK
jgi:hypothetical protein